MENKMLYVIVGVGIVVLTAVIGWAIKYEIDHPCIKSHVKVVQHDAYNSSVPYKVGKMTLYRTVHHEARDENQ